MRPDRAADRAADHAAEALRAAVRAACGADPAHPRLPALVDEVRAAGSAYARLLVRSGATDGQARAGVLGVLQQCAGVGAPNRRAAVADTLTDVLAAVLAHRDP